MIIGKSADMPTAAARIMNGKTLNAGQICLAPDYVLTPKESLESFVAEATGAVRRMFPTIRDNPDYTAIIAQRHYDRIQGYIDDARAKGARVVEIKPENEDLTQQEHRKIAPTLIIDPTDEMKVMQEEIFGPVLPVKTYSGVDEAIAYVNAHDRPLGLYYFGDDAAEREKVLSATTSGGVTVNDVIFHIAQEELPFGGRRPLGHGQLSRPRRLSRVQPPQVDLHPAEEGHRAVGPVATALWAGRFANTWTARSSGRRTVRGANDSLRVCGRFTTCLELKQQRPLSWAFVCCLDREPFLATVVATPEIVLCHSHCGTTEEGYP